MDTRQRLLELDTRQQQLIAKRNELAEQTQQINVELLENSGRIKELMLIGEQAQATETQDELPAA